ncbi:MAG: hypothetical protein ATN35_01210 [Epulopiscium sp. Nele67-Bin004]|nr:MAG: hypothetical protein ATN35_01210 [Epulopiscium sp. Nele67-Bin004]
MNEINLWLQVRNGDMQSLQTLIDKYSNYVATIITRVSTNQLSSQDVEELTADVFIKIWNKRDNLELENGSPKAYMARISRNITIDYLRKNNILTVEMEEHLEVSSQTPEDVILQQELQDSLVTVVKTLQQPEQEIFIRRYFYMEKIKDIATKLQLKENTVHTKLSRTKKKLQEICILHGLRKD